MTVEKSTGSTLPAAGSDAKYAVVSCDVLPEVFLKVMEVKRLLACGEEKAPLPPAKGLIFPEALFINTVTAFTPTRKS